MAKPAKMDVEQLINATKMASLENEMTTKEDIKTEQATIIGHDKHKIQVMDVKLLQFYSV